jgi:fluoride exporter
MRSEIFATTMIFLGGGTGTLGRYGVAVALKSVGLPRPGGFPLGTFFVNIVGCFAIGILAQAIVNGWSIRDEIRIALLIGVLGGFTTFSSFGLEAVQMWSDGLHWRAIAYVLASNIFGLAAAGLGIMLVGTGAGPETAS